MFDVLILGGGPAGLTAAIYAQRAGLSSAVLEKNVAGGQITTTHLLENYPGFPEGISGYDFSMDLLKQAERFGVSFIQEEALKVSLEGDVKMVVTDRNAYEAKTVVIACGVSPRELGIRGEEEFRGMGVSYCATCDGAFFRGLPVAVVGGGDTALEDALYLSDMASEVYLIHRRNEFRAQSYLVEKAAGKENIHFVLNCVPVEITGGFDLEKIAVEDKDTHEIKALDVAGVFIAAGQIPHTEIFRDQVETDTAGYIIAGESTETNVPGVFAAGDVRIKTLRQVVTAVADGAVAGTNAYNYIKGIR